MKEAAMQRTRSPRKGDYISMATMIYYNDMMHECPYARYCTYDGNDDELTEPESKNLFQVCASFGSDHAKAR